MNLDGNVEEIKKISKAGNAALMETIKDYKKLKERLFISVTNTKKSAELLEHVPRRDVADLSIICNMKIDPEWFDLENDGNIASLIVVNEIPKLAKISADQIIDDAIENAPKIVPALPLGSIEALLGKEQKKVPLYIVTNSANYKGAAALFYPGAMQKYAETLGGGYFILPSSIHEVLLMPYGWGPGVKDLKEIVETINKSEVDARDFLSDSVYYYNPEDGTFNIAEEY